MASALKEALNVGTGNASAALHAAGGYLDNARFKIPFPPDAMRAADKLRQIGLGDQVDKFIVTMNRGAEDAAAEAKPIFINAITSMTLNDAKNIVLGADNSATQYFQNKTTTALASAFSPKIKTALDKFSATKYWTNITSSYNQIPGVKPVDTDLVRFVTGKALDGLFLRVADEEKDIRNKVGSRISPGLKKVFGWADEQKKR